MIWAVKGDGKDSAQMGGLRFVQTSLHGLSSPTAGSQRFAGHLVVSARAWQLGGTSPVSLGTHPSFSLLVRWHGRISTLRMIAFMA